MFFGRIAAILDGDTINVLDENHQLHKIRFAGIDAPERQQPFGSRLKQALSHIWFS